MSSASFRSQIAGVVSDTLYIPVKPFLAPVGRKGCKSFLFWVCGIFCVYVSFFVLKREEAKWGEDGESPIVKVELVNLEQCCIYNFHTVINI